jgi:hypothetical protein
MADELRKCLLCQGEGTFRPSDVTARLADPELRRELENYLAKSSDSIPAGAAIGKGPADRNFEKEVHHWNPQMPIWRRSPKE